MEQRQKGRVVRGWGRVGGAKSHRALVRRNISRLGLLKIPLAVIRMTDGGVGMNADIPAGK